MPHIKWVRELKFHPDLFDSKAYFPFLLHQTASYSGSKIKINTLFCTDACSPLIPACARLALSMSWPTHPLPSSQHKKKLASDNSGLPSNLPGYFCLVYYLLIWLLLPGTSDFWLWTLSSALLELVYWPLASHSDLAFLLFLSRHGDPPPPTPSLLLVNKSLLHPHWQSQPFSLEEVRGIWRFPINMTMDVWV